jgi:hypothetical protein
MRNACLQMLDYRQHEQEQFNAVLNSSPVSVSVLLGSPDCGETAFVQQQQQQQPNRPVCYLNGRQTALTTPADMSRAIVMKVFPCIADSFAQMPEAALEKVGYRAMIALSSMMKLTFGSSIENLTSDTSTAQLVDGFKQASALIRGSHILTVTAADLAPVLETFHKLLELWQQSGMQHVPALIIDAADVLQEWPQEHGRLLRALLWTFVASSVQDNRCHVVLVTTEYSFVEWLTQRKWQVASSYSVHNCFHFHIAFQ